MQIKLHDEGKDSGNVFVVETFAESGTKLSSHKHEHAHTSVLVSGSAEVEIDGETKRYEGYNLLTVPADTTHEVRAITDIIWLCVWDSDLAPRELAEESLKLEVMNEKA